MARGRIAVLCAAIALAGCSGERDTSEGRKVESVVKQFALAHGPEACGAREAHASARALDRRRYYAVGLIKPRGRWLIQSVSVKSRQG